MELHKSTSSPGEPTKFGTERGDRFQTKTENPLRRRCPAIPRPMIPSPTTPMFVCFGWDADTGRSIGWAVQGSACRGKCFGAIQKFRALHRLDANSVK